MCLLRDISSSVAGCSTKPLEFKSDNAAEVDTGKCLANAKCMPGSGHVSRSQGCRLLSQVDPLVSLVEYFEEATNVLQEDGITSIITFVSD